MYNIARYVGIELEVCERWQNDDYPPKHQYWQKKFDGSVYSHDFGGSGREFVFLKPMRGNDVIDAVSNICHWLNLHRKDRNVAKCRPYSMIPQHYYVTTEDCGAGFHLHLDYRGMSDSVVLNFADVAHLIFDNVLRTVDESRKDNRYCLGYDTLPSVMYRNWYSNSLPAFDRYHAINVSNIEPNSSKSTVEIRLHEGTMDRDKILTWVEFWATLANLCDNNRVTPKFVREKGFKGLLNRMKLSHKTRERFLLCV